ncbi:hypothetical protein ACHAXM_009618 [Skeletonema potamos]|jgi:hypothetical protein
MMLPPSSPCYVDDIPSTIFCHFDELEECTEHDDDITIDVDVLDISTSTRSSFSDDDHLIELPRSGTTATSDHVTNQDLRAMKDMIASMRRNPELLNQSPVVQGACLSRSSLFTSDRFSASLIPDENAARHCVINDDYDVKNEDLRAMKDMIASMRRNPELLNQSPVMQGACLARRCSFFTSDRSSPSLIPDETAARHCVITDDYDVKNEDLRAMKDMIASIRRNPELLNQSPVMQRACFTATNTATAFANKTTRLVSPNEISGNITTSHRCDIKFDPSKFPSLPFSRSLSHLPLANKLARGVSLDKQREQSLRLLPS